MKRVCEELWSAECSIEHVHQRWHSQQLRDTGTHSLHEYGRLTLLWIRGAAVLVSLPLPPPSLSSSLSHHVSLFIYVYYTLHNIKVCRGDLILSSLGLSLSVPHLYSVSRHYLHYCSLSHSCYIPPSLHLSLSQDEAVANRS